jgi:arylsulfatase A-like enzyme
MALYILDEAVGDIVDALKTKGIMDNTYIIFS